MSETLKYILTLVAGGILLAVLNFVKGLLTIKSDVDKAEADANSTTINNSADLDDRWVKYVNTIEERQAQKDKESQKTITKFANSLERVENYLSDVVTELNEKNRIIDKAHDCPIPDEECIVLLESAKSKSIVNCSDCAKKVDNQ